MAPFFCPEHLQILDRWREKEPYFGSRCHKMGKGPSCNVDVHFGIMSSSSEYKTRLHRRSRYPVFVEWPCMAQCMAQHTRRRRVRGIITENNTVAI